MAIEARKEHWSSVGQRAARAKLFWGAQTSVRYDKGALNAKYEGIDAPLGEEEIITTRHQDNRGRRNIRSRM